MSKKVMILIIGLLAIVSISAFVSSSSAISTTNCSCHGGRSESLALLVGNAGNVLPTTINVGQTATVKVILQHTITDVTRYNTLNSVLASLASVSGHFSVSAPNVSLGSITGNGVVTATWTITGTSAGADSMRIMAFGTNPHEALTFSDAYAPAPLINVVAVTPPTPPPAAYTVTVTTVGSGAVANTPNTATYASGAVVQFTATPAAGWSFAGWSGTLTGTANPVSITMNTNKAVTATFTQNPPPPPPPATYTITATTVGSGSVTNSPNTATHSSGAVVQITATPAAGWSFAGWSGALTGTANPASITMNANKAITATFTQNASPPPLPTTYALTVTTNGSGTVAKSPNAATYTSDTIVQITAMPAVGWSFAGWMGALTGTASSASITMDANKAVTATFTQNPPPPPVTPPPVTPPQSSGIDDDDDHSDDDDDENENTYHYPHHNESEHENYHNYRSYWDHCDED